MEHIAMKRLFGMYSFSGQTPVFFVFQQHDSYAALLPPPPHRFLLFLAADRQNWCSLLPICLSIWNALKTSIILQNPNNDPSPPINNYKQCKQWKNSNELWFCFWGVGSLGVHFSSSWISRPVLLFLSCFQKIRLYFELCSYLNFFERRAG